MLGSQGCSEKLQSVQKLGDPTENVQGSQHHFHSIFTRLPASPLELETPRKGLKQDAAYRYKGIVSPQVLGSRCHPTATTLVKMNP